MANRTVSVALRAEIGQYVSGMTQAAAATRGLGDSVDTTTRRTRGGFDLAGKGALLLGGAVVAGLGLAVAKSMEFESAMSAAAAGTQATGAALADLRDAAMEAGAATQYSATEAAQAITEMGKAGVATADILGGGLDGALSLAAAGQLEVAKAAEIASVAMTQFKLAGDQLPHVADLLAAGAGKAMGSVEDLGMALNQAGLVASATGLNIEETTGVLAAFASAGLVGSDAGTSLKTMLQKLQAPSKEAAATMSDLGINMYDASGNFAGMDSLAGQLKTGMANLTPAVRDAAMATIFGSDAVRAANVLYSQGAEGIQDWTSKVNDAGYAAEQAAALNDNLAGDLEKLGGAFDTLMIEMGSGAQGPLRDLVQMFTGLIEAGSDLLGLLSAIPTPVYAVFGAMAAVAALKGPLSAMFIAMQVRAVLATSAILGATLSLTGLRAAASGVVGMLGGPWGVALAAAAVMVLGVTSSLQKSEDQVNAWKDALVNGGAAAAGVAAEAQRIRDKQPFEWMADLDEWTGFAPTMEDAARATEDYFQSLDPVAEAQARASQWASTLSYRIETLGKNHKDTQIAQERHAYWTDVLEGRQRNLTSATEGTNGAMERAATVVRDFGAEASAADAAISALQAALDHLSGETVTMFEAESQLGAAIDAAKGALEGKTGAVLNANGTLNAYSESGRAAGDVLLGVRDKGNQLIATMVQQGKTAGEVAQADADLRASFIQSAMAMGIEEGAANALADQILGIPSERHTQVTADVEQARREIADLATRLAGLRDRTITITARSVRTGVGIDNIDGNGAASGTGGMGRYASGGTPRAGEIALVGEEGPEIVRFGSAATVYTAAETRAMLSGRELSSTAPSFRGREFSGGVAAGGSPSVNVGGATIHVTLDGRELRYVARVEAASVVAGRDAALARNMRSARL